MQQHDTSPTSEALSRRLRYWRTEMAGDACTAATAAHGPPGARIRCILYADHVGAHRALDPSRPMGSTRTLEWND